MQPGRALAQIPLMGLVSMAVMKLWPSLYYVNRVRLDLVNHLPDIRLVYNVMTWPVMETRVGGVPFQEFQKSIVFDQVVFCYAGREPVLRGLSMVIQKDKVTAVVGRSGEGKTTIINLFLGLYEPQSGAILVDGVPLNRIDLQHWRAKIGLVPQDPFLFHGTIAENIAFGDPSFSRQQIEEAGRIALVDEIVEKLPDGYDTMVGDRGMKLSGGQQQRIAIARAVLRNPQVLIFDEATSSLDTVSERLVQEAIARTSRHRTVVLIAHRLSTVQHADKIIVLQQGRSIEEGTHSELSQADGVYSQLVQAAVMSGLEQRQ
jgi:ABC-type multidrug transport system fused ATPase/permease subunit